jgi:hypothetical protein
VTWVRNSEHAASCVLHPEDCPFLSGGFSGGFSGACTMVFAPYLCRPARLRGTRGFSLVRADRCSRGRAAGCDFTCQYRHLVQLAEGRAGRSRWAIAELQAGRACWAYVLLR